MLSVSLFYLLVGYVDVIIKKLNGKRNPISISIFKVMRRVGWIMLVASFFNFFYESVYWNIAYLSIAVLGIYVINLSTTIPVAFNKKT